MKLKYLPAIAFKNYFLYSLKPSFCNSNYMKIGKKNVKFCIVLISVFELHVSAKSFSTVN